MNRATLVGAGAAGAIASLMVGAIAFLGLGIYDIDADDHHTKVVLAIIEQLRERSNRHQGTRDSCAESR